MVTKPTSRAGLFGDDDRGVRHQLVAPAFAPPGHARVEIDRGIGELPGLEPQRDRGVLVLGAIGAKRETVVRPTHRSVSFSSMRRLRL